MITIPGKYSTANIYTDNIDNETISQLITLCNQDFTDGANIAIMPDSHAGKGCVIGFTTNLIDKIVPNLIGVDISCGILTVELGNANIDLDDLDRIIRKNVPLGRNVHSSATIKFDYDLNSWNYLKNKEYFSKSIGSLGGGNHFIELDVDESGHYYLVIHTGSRNLGKQVAEYYQKLAISNLKGSNNLAEQKKNLVESLKKLGQENLIQSALNKITRTKVSYPDDLCYLEGLDRDNYLEDMKFCQKYAELNRKIIANNILGELFNWDLDIYDFPHFETIHNYINFKDGILRKGAVSAHKDEILIIPINMRDGSLICRGLGNPEWNYSAPHGAGRLMSRSKAKELLSIDKLKRDMENAGIYANITSDILDESPDAYKPMQEIVDNIQETVEIMKIIKPVYNVKAGE